MPQLNLPLFDGGRNRANLDLAQVRERADVVAYEQAIEAAFREVANALDAHATLSQAEPRSRERSNASNCVLRECMNAWMPVWKTAARCWPSGPASLRPNSITWIPHANAC